MEGLDDTEEISEEDIVLLVDDEGIEYRYVLLAVLDVEGKDYAVLAPEEQLGEEEREEVELTFFEVVTLADGTERFVPIEDEDRFEAVQQACAEFLGLSEADE